MTARRALTVEPRGLSRTEAATYVGVGASLFDELVRVGKMPTPVRLKGRLIWDRRGLDRAMDELFDHAGLAAANDDPWSKVAL